MLARHRVATIQKKKKTLFFHFVSDWCPVVSALSAPLKMVSAGFDGFQFGFRFLRIFTHCGPNIRVGLFRKLEVIMAFREKSAMKRKNNRRRRVSDSAKRVAWSANLYLAILRNDMTQGKDKVSRNTRRSAASRDLREDPVVHTAHRRTERQRRIQPLSSSWQRRHARWTKTLRSEPPLTRPIQRILFAPTKRRRALTHAQKEVLNEGKQTERNAQGDSNARETCTFQRVSPDTCCFPPNVLHEKPRVTVQMAERDHTCTACAAVLLSFQALAQGCLSHRGQGFNP